MDKKYFLGLDIGTDSVGFAATDTEYNVIKKGKKQIIGTRLFESGHTAEERRGFRSSRRRISRNKQRISFLRELFNKEICKVDPNFFMRLDESMYHYDDKSTVQYNSLFNDKDFKDKDYFKKYPTIFHLRKALINDEANDVRLLYLGLEHIIKNRGHFLFMGQDFGEISEFKVAFSALKQVLAQEEYEKFNFEITDLSKMEEIIKDKSKGITARSKEIQRLLPLKPTANQKDIINIILGGSVKLKKLFDDIDEDIASKSLTFKGDFESLYAEIAPKLDEHIVLIDTLKAIYDWSILTDILDCPHSDNTQITLSDAKIHKYETHKSDLKCLKAMVRQCIPEQFKEIFEDPSLKTNYPAYVGMTKVKRKKLVIKEHKCSGEDFCKYINAKIKDIQTENKEFIELQERVKNNTAFPKQRTKDNSVIPMQVHKKELDLILENNADKFEFLSTSDGEYTVAQKIQAIFSYRIPYYVGPLNEHSDFSWLTKNLEEKITPWNFEKIVNLEDSAEAFIRRMTNKCTYLRECDVIPQKSLLYSKFTLLNELNNLKLNGQGISVELKQELFENLFKLNKKVTRRKLVQYLSKHSYCAKDVVITGIDGDFKGSLESYIAFENILGSNFDEQMVEDIIKWIVLFSDDKAMLKRKILLKYKLTDNQIKDIQGLKYKGWGRLSREFLTEVYAPDKNTGEAINIIDAMYHTNLNLMQLLSNEYDYINQINARKTSLSDITLENIKELYCSPAVKKSIWQAVQIVKEIEKVMGSKPEKLFIEVTRAEGDKAPTTSRKRDLQFKYNSIKKEYSELASQLEGKSESDLRMRKLYLYFTQLGRCAYTGREIDIDMLGSDMFDIEHIYPRSKTKDDSLHNNLVLVYKTANADKSDVYPIPDKYRQEELWKLWHKKELINKEKFDRLMRTHEFAAKELEGFIARQLVETSQASKAVAELFKGYYADTKSEVVYVKAGNVSDFRHHFDIVKVREINDYHHAHDAYLNIVVGNVWHTKFTTNFYKNIQNEKFNLKPEKLYGYDVKKGDYFAWKVASAATIKTVKDVVDNAKILFTRQAYKVSGTLFDQTIYKKGQGEFAVKNPLDTSKMDYKLTDISKYGSFKSIKGAYFCVVEHEVKSKKVRTIEYVPIYLAKQIEDNPSMLENYLLKKLNITSPKIILRELKYGALLNVDGFPMHISGRTGERISFKGGIQLKLSKTDIKYIKKLSKISERLKFNPNIKVADIDKITLEDNLRIYNLFADKLKNSIYKITLEKQGLKLEKNIEIFEKLSVEKQCEFLIKALVLFQCNIRESDLSIIGESNRSGSISMSKKISERNSVRLINQSITGIYENYTDLLK